jgi:hypothetical protein
MHSIDLKWIVCVLKREIRASAKKMFFGIIPKCASVGIYDISNRLLVQINTPARVQGDQIWRIFAQLLFAYFGE